VVLGWGFTALNAAVPDEPAQSVAQLVLKLVTMVALPAWLFLRAGRRVVMQASRHPGPGWLTR
jgi:hypothetical protein